MFGRLIQKLIKFLIYHLVFNRETIRNIYELVKYLIKKEYTDLWKTYEEDPEMVKLVLIFIFYLDCFLALMITLFGIWAVWKGIFVLFSSLALFDLYWTYVRFVLSFIRKPKRTTADEEFWDTILCSFFIFILTPLGYFKMCFCLWIFGGFLWRVIVKIWTYWFGGGN